LYGQRPCNKGRTFARKVLIREPPQKEGAFAIKAVSCCMFLEGEASP